MALTKKATAAGGLDTIIGDAVIAFDTSNVCYPLVSVKQAPMGAAAVTWPEYTQITYSSVTQPTEGTDTTATAITTTARTATIVEHVIQADLSDLVVMGSADGLQNNVGPILGNAVGGRLDYNVTQLFSSFAAGNDQAAAGTTLTLAHIFGAIKVLHAAGAPGPYSLVMSDEGIWGAKGLRPLLVDSAVTGSNAKPMSFMGAQGQEFLSRGFVTNLGNVNIYFCNQINDSVASSGDSASGMFSPAAIGLAVGAYGLFRIEDQRDASARLTEYVAVGFWKEAIIKDVFGSYILHDVS